MSDINKLNDDDLQPPLTVGELLTLLARYPDDLPVYYADHAFGGRGVPLLAKYICNEGGTLLLSGFGAIDPD